MFICKIEEVQRQLSLSGAKLIVGLSTSYDVLSKAVSGTQTDIPVVCVKFENTDSMPAGAIDFFELIDTSSEIALH